MALKSTLARDESKLLSNGMVAGPMPWVIAIMVFLTILAAAAGLSIASGASQNNEALARKMTVQILEENPIIREAQRENIIIYLQQLPQTLAVEPLSDQDIAKLLEPWLGVNNNIGTDADDLIPLPAIIDVEMKQIISPPLREEMADAMGRIAPSVRVDTQESWVAPLYDLMKTLILLTIGLVLLLAMATSATVVLAVRSALDTHRRTLEIMHLMGSTDNQISRLFQRRVAFDAFFGGSIGYILGCITIYFLSVQINTLNSDIISQISMPWYGWIILAFIPLLMCILSVYMARWTVRRSMKKIL